MTYWLVDALMWHFFITISIKNSTETAKFTYCISDISSRPDPLNLPKILTNPTGLADRPDPCPSLTRRKAHTARTVERGEFSRAPRRLGCPPSLKNTDNGVPGGFFLT